MTTVIIIFMLVILILIMAIGAYASNIDRFTDDPSFYKEDGDHIYYDRSIIKKKEFCKKHPDADPRSFTPSGK